ncbi:hypothetical protein Vretimale_14520 [Volvox reticuliferus]|uniref:Uncharacterized protein n=1 Tax=Volvox reticuliferus TaxID=1737510 RepID=A0A8J4CQG9_9CHLO|nr:hypothetical protein Vretifemale_13305 [Volvox reticuliferus]GIM10921.1 hypothetical protein Vretimale_14520 [Volvox reticuliferus]
MTAVSGASVPLPSAAAASSVRRAVPIATVACTVQLSPSAARTERRLRLKSRMGERGGVPLPPPPAALAAPVAAREARDGSAAAAGGGDAGGCGGGGALVSRCRIWWSSLTRGSLCADSLKLQLSADRSRRYSTSLITADSCGSVTAA